MLSAKSFIFQHLEDNKCLFQSAHLKIYAIGYQRNGEFLLTHKGTEHGRTSWVHLWRQLLLSHLKVRAKHQIWFSTRSGSSLLDLVQVIPTMHCSNTFRFEFQLNFDQNRCKMYVFLTESCSQINTFKFSLSTFFFKIKN